MNNQEQYAIALIKNCNDYLLNRIMFNEIEQINYDSNNNIYFPVTKILYMQSVLKEQFLIQYMNNVIKHQCFNFHNHQIYSLKNTVELNKNRIKEISNNIVAYVFNHIDLQFNMFKTMIPDELNIIILNAYILDYIEPIDLYYCSQYIKIETDDDYLNRFFRYCDKHIEVKEKNFISKLQDVLKKIIKKYEEMI